MLNTAAGLLGLLAQASVFLVVYLVAAPSRGRSIALLYAALAAVDGYALTLLGFATVGIPWQVTNVLLAIAVVGVATTRWARQRLRRTVTGLGRWWLAALPAAAILAALVAIQVLAIVLTPDLSVDGQLYHGPVLAQLVETGTVWGWQAPNQYMYYTDLTMLGGVNLATFTGTVVFDNGIQLPHLVVLILALNVLLARRFRRSWTRLAFAALIVSGPAIWLQPRILYVDVAYGAAVAALLVLIVTARRFAVADMLMAGVCAASILAAKPTGILTSALLIVVWIIVAWWRRRRAGARMWRAVWPAVVAAAIPMCLGLGFYLRNLVAFGNPVYPVQAVVGPLRLRGIIDLSVFASGDRGSGLVDPSRLLAFAASIGTGMLHGVTKPDYDPRAGGYGYVPLIVLLVAAAVVVAQGVWALAVRRRRPVPFRVPWRVQLGAIGLSAAVLVIQPSSFDSRYVIGPTGVILAAVAMSSIFAAPAAIELTAAGCALLAAAVQITWTEANAYPGLHIAKELRTLTRQYQPITPGNPWGRGESVSWLPTTGCAHIVLQTSGGVTASGMAERSELATFPYGLYGDELCNTVSPVQLGALTTQSATADPVPTADYLVLYRQDVGRWRALYPSDSSCWRTIQTVPASPTYPQSVVVLANACR